MKKLFYLGFALVLAMGVGCAITDYSVIVDNDQVANGQGSGIVNTSGKAHLVEGSQIATLWPDGADEIINFVDQKANGDQVLTTYNNFSSAYPIFHDDLYCNPDWAGCAITTAQNPVVGDADIFDYKWNPSCKGARSLSLLLSTTRYYGECGRAKISWADRVKAINLGTLGRAHGMEGLFYNLNHNNLTVTLDNNAGYVTTLPVTADATLFVGGQGRHKGMLDLTNPLMMGMFRSYADFLANHATHQTNMTVTYEGISLSYTIAGNYGISNPSNVLSIGNGHY